MKSTVTNNHQGFLIHVDVNPQEPTKVAFASKTFAHGGGCSVTDITNYDLLNASGKGRVQLNCGPFVTVRTRPNKDVATTKLPPNYYRIFEAPIVSFLSVTLSSAILAIVIHSYFLLDMSSWKAMMNTILNMILISILVHRTASLWIVRDYNKYGQVQKSDTVTLDIEIHGSDIDGVGNEACLAPPEEISNASNNAPLTQEPHPTGIDGGGASTTESTAERTKIHTKPVEESEDIVPFRFIRATKGNFEAAKIRWRDTLAWRKQMKMNSILQEPHPKIKIIKEHYPHFFHLRGRKNECCYYESPPKMNLDALRKEGLNIEDLLRHYALCTEYMWKEIEPSEEGRSIYVIDLDGIRLFDFAGEVIDFVKRASAIMAAHYPERSGSIFVINVPTWFSVIWNAVRPLVDEVTQKKITILRVGAEAITKALEEKISIDNIPPEYGGKSMPLGFSPEDQNFMMHYEKINQAAADEANNI
jgi:hypothetical protein